MGGMIDGNHTGSLFLNYLAFALNFITQDFFSVFFHPLHHKVKVVDSGKGKAGDFIGFEQVVDVG